MDRKRPDDSSVELSRAADRCVAGPPPQEPGDHRLGRGGAGRSPSRADRFPQRRGLADDEAFLVAVKRMGAVDALTREFAREHSDRLWKQLVLSGDGADGGARVARDRRLPEDVGRARPGRRGGRGDQAPGPLRDRFRRRRPVLLAQHQLLHSPFIAAYFAWDRPLPRSSRLWLAAFFVLAAIVANAFPFSPSPGADTEILTAIHLPIALWLAVGVAYVGGRWRGSERRMDFVRFTGELFIYFVLIALGGMCSSG